MILSPEHSIQTLAGRKILAVDDSKEITELLADILSADGAKVRRAHTGHEAMLLLANGVYDLLILDLAMPEPNGWDVLEFASKAAPGLLPNTIVLTAMKYDYKTAKTLRSKGVAHMFKPFSIESLRNMLLALPALSGPPQAA